MGIKVTHPLRVVLTWAVFVLVVATLPLVTFAQEQGEGLSISPAVIEPSTSLDPGTSQQFSVTLKNLNSKEQKFYLSTRDIIDVAENSTPIFSDGREEKTGMELSSWVKLPMTDITLAPGVSEKITFTIDVPQDASPGSHFGSIIISVDPPEIQQSGAAVGYQVANIITLRVTGDAVVDANVRQLSTDRYFNGSKNVDFSARIENAGNVLIRPIGPVEISNMLGQKVDTFTFNGETQSAVFPGKVREFEFKWTGEGTGFGRYEAVLSAIYGEEGAKKTMSSTVSFWILPIKIIGPALAGLAFLLLVTFLFVKLYIRRTLANMTYGRARVVSNRRRSKNVSATLLLVVVMLTVTVLFMVLLLALFA